MNMACGKALVLALMFAGGSHLFAQTSGAVNNWPVQYSRNVAESTNVQIDDHKGLETIGAPAKAAWSRQVQDAGTYLLKVKYNPMPDRAMKVAFNGVSVSTKGMDAPAGSDTDVDCDKAAKWRPLGTVTVVAGANSLVAEPVDPNGKLPHLCAWELVKQ